MSLQTFYKHLQTLYNLANSCFSRSREVFDFMGKILLFLLLFIFLPTTTKAVQGACSYHGGVDCTKTYSIYAVCNDGFQSSELLSQMIECKQNSCDSLMATALTLKCKNDNDLLTIKNEYQKTYDSWYSNNLRSGLSGNTPPSNNSVINCEQDIKSYNELLNSYKSCTENKFSTVSNQADYQISMQKLNAQILELENKKEQEINAYLNKLKNEQYCAKNYRNSVYDETTDSCKCKQGDFLTTNLECLTSDDIKKIQIEHEKKEYELKVSKALSYQIVDTIKLNDKNNDVKKLHLFLLKNKYTSKVSKYGFFDVSTKKSLVSFQKKSGLKANGIVDEATKQYINAIIFDSYLK